jgi:hypothetical protein
MENTDKVNKINSLKGANGNMAWSLGLSLFWVIFLWGFWQKDVYALGLNAFVFISGGLIFFLRPLIISKRFLKNDWLWLLPLVFIIFSFLIYENPFLKIINLFIVLAAFILFYNFSQIKEKNKLYWNFYFITNIINRALSALAEIGNAVNSYFKLIKINNSQKTQLIKRIILGLILLVIISAVFIIPLLSAADPVFADNLKVIMSWIGQFISKILIIKILFFIFLAIVLLTLFLAWGKEFIYPEKEFKFKNKDPIISGIVIGGILLLYLLFIWLQFKYLWLGSLPFAFKETEILVKSGFWQLIFLSVINIYIFYLTYKKTALSVQRILTIFTVASLLLLLSAGHRMFLYVTNYGFSYEKFYAAYTIVFCGLLFIWLLSQMFLNKRADILKFILFLFIWMYAVIALFPAEQFILKANLALINKPGSHIRLSELTMLSADVLPQVKSYWQQGLLNENYKIFSEENNSEQVKQFDWAPWINKQEVLVASKAWYELNLENIIYKINN